MIKCIIFDMDGTILDSMHVWQNLDEVCLSQFGKKADEDLKAATRGMSMEQSAQYMISHYGIDVTVEDFLKSVYEAVQDQYFHTVSLKDGALEFLKRCNEKGLKLCIATANDRFLTEPALKRTGADKYIDFTITCSEAGEGKDKPDVFFRCTESMGVTPEETVVFEDSRICIETVKNAGFHTVAVRDNCTDEEWLSLTQICDMGIESFNELL